MLRHLSIQNFAVIESIVIDFEPGLNIIIGETGSGKSIIIDSLSILLGEKALTSYIRDGAKKAIIEGIFRLSLENPVLKILSENDIDILEVPEKSDSIFELIIRREISATGNSRIFINDSPAQYSLLKEIGDLIIDFHGQFDHQSLINPQNHIHILDAYANNFSNLCKYRTELEKLKTHISNYKKFLDNQNFLKKEFEQKKLLLEEINALNPSLNEDDELAKELKLLENSESIHLALLDILGHLGSDEFSLVNNLNQIKKKLDNLSRFDKNFDNYNSVLAEQIPFFNDFSNFLQDYFESFKFDPMRVEEINQRLFLLQQMKRRIGTIEEILKLQSELSDFVDSYSDLKKSEDELIKEISKQFYDTNKLANILSESRHSHLLQFQKKIEELLKELGFSFVKFEIKLKTNILPEIEIKNILSNLPFNTNGIDDCEFMISANLGENTKPLARIASGGELSRIMLSLKTMAASDKNLPILVFDEIDSGVSGRIAQRVGELMKKFSANHQIICITHSPQVTAAGNCVISIDKIESEGRTISVSHKLSSDESIVEIAKFLSGSNVSASALESAKALIENYKN